MNEQNQESSCPGKQSSGQEADDYNSFSLTLQTLSRASIATLEKKKIEIAAANRSFFDGLKKLSLEEVSRAIESSTLVDLIVYYDFLNSIRTSLTSSAKNKIDSVKELMEKLREEGF